TIILWDVSAAIADITKLPTQPESTSRAASTPKKTDSMTPWFYLSFAKTDGDIYFQQFVSDLSLEISHRYGRSVSLVHDLSSSESWTKSVLDAVRTCKVAICVLSPSYFVSEWCGKEFQIFRNRSASSK